MDLVLPFHPLPLLDDNIRLPTPTVTALAHAQSETQGGRVTLSLETLPLNHVSRFRQLAHLTRNLIMTSSNRGTSRVYPHFEDLVEDANIDKEQHASVWSPNLTPLSLLAER